MGSNIMNPRKNAKQCLWILSPIVIIVLFEVLITNSNLELNSETQYPKKKVFTHTKNGQRHSIKNSGEALSLTSNLHHVNFSTKKNLLNTKNTHISRLSNEPPSLNLSFEKGRIDGLLHRALDKAAKMKKVIVIWYKSPWQMVQKDKELSWNCGSCAVTHNRNMITDDSTSAVVFLYRDVLRDNMPPASIRRSDQLYVWRSGESPTALHILRKMQFFVENRISFNATMSYRRDSDVYSPYGIPSQIVQKRNLPSISSKTSLAVAVVSNCGPLPGARARYLYLLKLQTKLEIDLYGKCFSKKKIPNRTESMPEFIRWLSKYKFYFAFENSYHCRDYITEKLFINAITSGSVPIVWGAKKEDYEAIIPRGSFIFVEDYPSMDSLVQHLKYLDENDTAYMEYHRILRDVTKNTHPEATKVCRLCRIIHGINIDDIYNPGYNMTSHQRPLFDSSMSWRSVPSIRQWILGDHKECFQSTVRIKS